MVLCVSIGGFGDEPSGRNALRYVIADPTNLLRKERGCEKACSRAISEGTQNAWTEQRGQAAILAGKR